MSFKLGFIKCVLFVHIKIGHCVYMLSQKSSHSCPPQVLVVSRTSVFLAKMFEVLGKLVWPRRGFGKLAGQRQAVWAQLAP